MRYLKVSEVVEMNNRTELTHREKQFYIDNLMKNDNEFFISRPGTEEKVAAKLRRTLKCNEKIMLKMEINKIMKEKKERIERREIRE